MPATRIATGRPDLTPVLGALDELKLAVILAKLDGADERLSSLRETLAGRGEADWLSEGVVLQTADSGQASIDALLSEAAGRLSFGAQLRPRNYFPTEAEMWRPGRPPLRMATDGWDVDGAVAVRFRTRVSGRPATIQQQVHELPEQRYDDPVTAAVAFAELVKELETLALSREPTAEAWRPPEPGDRPWRP